MPLKAEPNICARNDRRHCRLAHCFAWLFNPGENHAMSVLLIIGGAKSGKSVYAERTVLAMTGAGARPIYVATGAALDDEMAARIAAHRDRRANLWETIDAPVEVVRALDDSDRRGPRLVDCLTLWLSNLMLEQRDWRTEADSLCQALRRQWAPVVLVANEVGLGIVPDNALARRFRDAAGTINQMVAGTADGVVFMAAGLPMKLK
jgi:adenosylcobinamide kinase/adenosylcobinamide-phosphate guanylyltransferase